MDKPSVSKLCAYVSNGFALDTRTSHTFSIPKNLSLPSCRIGPALRSIFSNGVSSGAGSDFFAAFELGPGLDGPYCTVSDPKTSDAQIRQSNGTQCCINSRLVGYKRDY